MTEQSTEQELAEKIASVIAYSVPRRDRGDWAKFASEEVLALIKEEWQARVEKIKGGVETGMPDTIHNNSDWWQEFWKREGVK